MSHFEPTCQLTGLPILNDDPVLVLPVVHQYDDNHMDCPDDRAVPLLLPSQASGEEAGRYLARCLFTQRQSLPTRRSTT